MLPVRDSVRCRVAFPPSILCRVCSLPHATPRPRSVVGVLSVVHLIPARRDNALLKSFVARNWTAFCAPLFMLNVAILSFIACILTVGIFIYSYNLAFGGFAWAGAVLLVLLRFQYTITHRTIKEYPPHDLAAPGALAARSLVFSLALILCHQCTSTRLCQTAHEILCMLARGLNGLRDDSRHFWFAFLHAVPPHSRACIIWRTGPDSSSAQRVARRDVGRCGSHAYSVLVLTTFPLAWHAAPFLSPPFRGHGWSYLRV